MKICLLIVLLLILPHWLLMSQDYIILGQEEGEGELIAPRIMAEGPDGNIYVYDARSVAFKVYSPTGKYLRQFGRKGEGPGEIKRSDGLRFGFNHKKRLLYFSEFWNGHRWLTLMALDGTVQQTLKLKIKRQYGILGITHLEDGGFLLKIDYDSSYQGIKDYFLYKTPMRLLHVNNHGEIIREIIKREFFTRISFIKSGADLEIPFIPRFIWTKLKDTILFCDGSSQHLLKYDLHGKYLGTLTVPLPQAEKIIDKDVEQWKKQRKEDFNRTVRSQAWYKEFGRVIEKYHKSIYKTKPNCSGLSTTHGGNLLIKGPWEDNQPIPYILADSTGKELARINSLAYRVTMEKTFVLFQFRDEEENSIVSFIKRRGSEGEDLLRLAKIKFTEDD